MGNWTIGKRLFTGIAALSLLLLLVGSVAIWSAGSLVKAMDEAVDVHANGRALSTEILVQVTGALSAQRMFLASGFTTNRELFRKAVADADARVIAVHKTAAELRDIASSDEERQALAKADAAIDGWKQVKDQAASLVNSGQPQQAFDLAVARATPFIIECETEAARLIEIKTKALADARAAGDASYTFVRWLTLGMLALSLLVGAGVAFLVRRINASLRTTATELREASEQVVSAATQVATSAQSLSQGATEQAASLEESSASMEEMGAMTSQNAENAGQAAALMQEVDRQVTASNEMLKDMVRSMSEIQESSAQVAKIIKTIDEIAFQTNILALNAAVEAARAGEAGMGFAVVADEVRSLAQRAAQAARDTAVLIEGSSASATQGGQRVQRVAEAIGQFTESVAKVREIADGVSHASRQQSQGISQVSSAIQQMEKVTQTTAATAEESAAASEELNAQAETTLHLIRGLEAMVGGAQSAAPTVRHDRKGKPRATRSSGGPNVLRVRRPAVRTPEDVIPLESGSFGSF